jgi:hypothetical protein
MPKLHKPTDLIGNKTEDEEIINTAKMQQHINDFNFTTCDYKHTNCSMRCNRLYLNLVGGLMINHDFILKFLSYIQKSAGGHSYYKCVECKTSKWTQCLVMMIDQLPIIDQLFDIIIDTVICNTDNNLISIIKKYLENGARISDQQFKNMCTAKKYNVIDLMMDYYEINKSSMIMLTSLNSCNIDTIIRKTFNQKIDFDEQMLENLLRNRNYDLAKDIIKLGCPISQTCLKIACSKLNIDCVEQILQFKIKPNSLMFNTTIMAYEYDEQQNDNDLYRRQRYKDRAATAARIAKSNPIKIATIIDMLVNAGYKITYDNVIFALKKKCYINNINRFNIKFTSEFIEKCIEFDYYPYPELKIKPDIKCLRLECKKLNKIANIKKIVKQGIEPDIGCLQDACTAHNNVQTIAYLIDTHGIKPDILCLQNITKYLYNANLNLVLKHVSINNDEKQVSVLYGNVAKTVVPNTYEDDEEDEKDSDKIGEESEESSYTDKSEVVVKPAKTMSSKKEEIPSPKDYKSDKCKQKPKTNLEKLADDLGLADDFNDFNIDINGSNIKEKKQQVVNVIEDTLVKPTIETNLKIIELVKPTDSVIKNPRNKVKVDNTIIKLFNIKNNMMSFIQLRKMLLEYISKNDLYYVKDKIKFIKPNKLMNQALNLDQGLLKVTDLDILVHHIYTKN